MYAIAHIVPEMDSSFIILTQVSLRGGQQLPATLVSRE